MIRVEFSSEVGKQIVQLIPGVKEMLPQREQTGQEKSKNPSSSVWLLESEPGLDIRAEVFKFAVSKGLTVLSMQKEEQKLEEVFQELTKN
jgi:hypothetical protein